MTDDKEPSFKKTTSVNKTATNKHKRPVCQCTHLTMVVAGSHHGVKMLRPTALGEDAEGGQVAVATGYVQRRVTAVVHQRRVTAGRQQVLTDVRLVCDHRQVEGSLGRRKATGEIQTE